MAHFPAILKSKKQANQRITMLTAYDAMVATLIAKAGVDVILVGDSLGNTFAGHATTLPVTMDQMVYHTQAVVRGAPDALVIADMPFLSYQSCIPTAIANAGRFLKEAGAQGVKLETAAAQVGTVQALTEAGIPVMAHVGLLPQSVNQLGGYAYQGKTDAEAIRLVGLCLDLQTAGAFAIVLELLPAALAAEITQALEIPTIGIGAGPNCDGQVLVISDLLGLQDRKLPGFVKPYASLHAPILSAISQFKSEVDSGVFPGTGYTRK